MSRYRPIYPAFAAIDLVYKLQQERNKMQYDETRLSGTYGSDIDPLDDLQVEDFYGDEPDYQYDGYDVPPVENGDIYFEPYDPDNCMDYGMDIDDNDEPDLWMDDVTEDFPF